jgi:hypothetical protein
MEPEERMRSCKIRWAKSGRVIQVESLEMKAEARLKDFWGEWKEMFLEISSVSKNVRDFKLGNLVVIWNSLESSTYNYFKLPN